MFEPTSRYYLLPDATLTRAGEDGRLLQRRYKRRRFIPSAQGMTTVLEHTIAKGDRLDNVTARYLGDPAQFWRIADGNLVLHPEELEEAGRRMLIALPQL
jgi:hypothetical protein